MFKSSQTAAIQRLRYPGGKGGVGVYQKLINCMPPHKTYIEAFLGGGAVLRHKILATRTVGIDLDAALIQYWEELRFPSLELIHGDALQTLQRWPWTAAEAQQTLVYCDPPYLQSTRRSARRVYKYDLGTSDAHSKLLQILLNLPCMVMVSGYSCPLYESLIGHWRKVQFHTTNRAGKRTLENVWLNFPVPSTLHDYRYLGDGFRERQRIKRSRERWRRRFARLPQLEQEAVLFDLHQQVQRPSVPIRTPC